jgi:hypothetical protein
MSNISTAYDEIAALLSSTLPTHKEMINPYLPELNDDITYDKSFGLAFGEGINTNLQLACRMSIDRNMRVILTRKIFSGNLMRGTDALTVRKNAEKNLFEDQFLVIKAMEESPTITDSGVITKCVFQSDSGLEFARIDRIDLIMITSTFVLSYFEQLNQ